MIIVAMHSSHFFNSREVTLLALHLIGVRCTAQPAIASHSVVEVSHPHDEHMHHHFPLSLSQGIAPRCHARKTGASCMCQMSKRCSDVALWTRSCSTIYLYCSQFPARLIIATVQLRHILIRDVDTVPAMEIARGPSHADT